MGGHPVLDDGGGVVGGAVVDDEDFGVPALFRPRMPSDAGKAASMRKLSL